MNEASAMLAALFLLAFYCAGRIPNRCISDTRKHQKYVFHIRVMMADSNTYRFDFYSDHPYTSIAEIMQSGHIPRKADFIEVSYQGKAVTLNKSRIVSASMEVCKNEESK